MKNFSNKSFKNVLMTLVFTSLVNVNASALESISSNLACLPLPIEINVQITEPAYTAFLMEVRNTEGTIQRANLLFVSGANISGVLFSVGDHKIMFSSDFGSLGVSLLIDRMTGQARMKLTGRTGNPNDNTVGRAYRCAVYRPRPTPRAF